MKHYCSYQRVLFMLECNYQNYIQYETHCEIWEVCAKKYLRFDIRGYELSDVYMQIYVRLKYFSCLLIVCEILI